MNSVLESLSCLSRLSSNTSPDWLAFSEALDDIVREGIFTTKPKILSANEHSFLSAPLTGTELTHTNEQQPIRGNGSNSYQPGTYDDREDEEQESPHCGNPSYSLQFLPPHTVLSLQMILVFVF